MANLNETPQWEAGIYQLETSDPVLGGQDGISNRQAKQLANRTAFLKALTDDAAATKFDKTGGMITGPVRLRGQVPDLLLDESDRLGSEGLWHLLADGGNFYIRRNTSPNRDFSTETYPLTITKDDVVSFIKAPVGPTPALSTNDGQYATTAFVQAALAALVASSPAALDTLNELAAALGNDANFATTMANALALKAPLASPALTGAPTAPTPAQLDSSTKLATTAFVKGAGLSFAGSVYFNSLPATLDATYAGRFTAINGGTASTVTLPLSSVVPVGTAITLVNESVYAQTISRQGADIIVAGNSNSANSYVMDPGTFAVFTSDTGGWHMGLRTTQLGLTGVFSAALGYNGYQKLPSGLIVQWGTTNPGPGDVTTTFPITFPNLCLHVIAGGGYTAGSGSIGYVSAGTWSKTNFVARQSSAGLGWSWLALGY